MSRILFRIERIGGFFSSIYQKLKGLISSQASANKIKQDDINWAQSLPDCPKDTNAPNTIGGGAPHAPPVQR
jgi:hypothetical protein